MPFRSRCSFPWEEDEQAFGSLAGKKEIFQISRETEGSLGLGAVVPNAPGRAGVTIPPPQESVDEPA